MLGGKGAPCSDPGWQGPTEDTTGKKETELRLEPREIGPVWNYIFKRIIPGRQILFLRCKVLGCKSATKFCFPDSRDNSGICLSTEFFTSQGPYFVWLCANQVSKQEMDSYMVYTAKLDMVLRFCCMTRLGLVLNRMCFLIFLYKWLILIYILFFS